MSTDHQDGETGQGPLYRLRLFLSVDLVGSTAFKSKDDETNLVWIKAFQKFYEQFPKMFRKNYREFCSDAPEIDTNEKLITPKVWKTIGDEIIFVNRVHSVAHLAAYVISFRKTLITFGDEVNGTYKLNTKGNGWIAAFPTPNRSIRLALDAKEESYSSNDDILTEADEVSVDDTPSQFDFLGKGIDGGFRISRNSAVDAMTLSPALAYLLCRAHKNVETTKFNCQFSFREPEVFKGVMGGKKYPVVSLITSRDEAHEKVECLEAELLDRPRAANAEKLYEYLDRYIEAFNVERPTLKLSYGSADIAPPPYYVSYIEEWQSDLQQIEKQKKTEQEAAQNPETEEGLLNEDTDKTAVELLVARIDTLLQQQSSQIPVEANLAAPAPLGNSN
jgi:hypothetical protein